MDHSTKPQRGLPPLPVLLALPSEILCLVLRKLDVLSIKALLEVFPPLRQCFILFTDMEALEMSRLYLPGIETVDIDQVSRFNGWRHTKLVFLYEFGDRLRSKIPLSDNISTLCPMLRESTISELLRHLNSRSFVYVHHILHFNLISYTKWKRLLAVTKCADVLFEPYDGPKEPEYVLKRPVIDFAFDASEFPNTMSFGFDIESITSLELSGVSSVVGPVKFTCLNTLMIHFKGRAPEFRNFSARRVSYLGIFYEDGFPNLSSLEIGSGGIRTLDHLSTQQQDLGPYSTYRGGERAPVLIIAQEGARNHHIYHQLPPCPTSPEKIDSMDFGFAKHFQFVNVYGGHDMVLDKVCHKCIRALNWKQANVQVDGGECINVICLPNLTSFCFESFIENSRLPFFQSISPLQVGVITHNSGLDLGPFCAGIRSSQALYVQVHCLSEKEEDTIRIPVMLLPPPGEELAMLELDGCTIDPLYPREERISAMAWAKMRNMKGEFKDFDNSPEP